MTYTIYTASTNVNAGDAFTMTTGDRLLMLTGSLLASSAHYGVNASGAVVIEVAGTVTGLYNAIYDLTVAGDKTVIYIDKPGYVIGGVGNEGIKISGAGTHTIFNSGAVECSGVNGWGVDVSGSGLIANNAGAAIIAGMGIRDNDVTSADANVILNYGLIEGSEYSFCGTGYDKETLNNQGSMVGAIVMSNNTANLLYNLGTIDATNVTNYTGFAVENSAVFNSGLMYQVVTGSTATIMIQTYDAAGDYVYNTGTLAEIVGAGANSADAAIALGNGAGDYVYNSGVIYGNVVLGNGAGDSYLGVNGKISGTIICGSGGDRINTGSDIEIVKAGTGNDTFNVGNGGESIIQETAANQISNGFDIVSNFQSYVAASQQGTFLQLDPSFASSTTFSAYNGGTLVQMSLGGGHYSYVDVLGASVAAVQAQTYFA